MQAIILAAGMGNRLGKYTKNNTKCMLPINGRSLIERALDVLDSSGIKKCIIVAGYKKDNLISFIGNKYKNIDITYVINDVYNKTNNIYSLYLAKDYLLTDDTLLLESDIIFEPRIITELLENPEPTLTVVAPFESWMDGTVAQFSQDNIITSFIPKKIFNFDDRGTYYKTVNIYKFSLDFLQNCYVPFLEAYIKTMGNNEYYEEVLRVISTLDNHPLKAIVLSDHKWYEIDDVQDKDIAEVLFSDNTEDRLNKLYLRYGGYWRFPKLIDFCYLVNPYFPTMQFQNEIKSCFNELLTEYPSGLDIQNMLAAKIFNLEPENILTGNGAAELIRAAANTISGKTGIIYPTFNEYPESFENSKIISFNTKDINYNIDDVTDWIQQCDMLVLINPDNPSGNFIASGDIINLLKSIKNTNKKLLLDESFIDFCDCSDSTLLKQEILDEFPNLIVIKSLSKSYGIPGIRLGVLACSDNEVIGNARKKLSIWNINSFAEFFLQSIGKYTKDYKLACLKVIKERERFYSELKKTALFVIYESQANYFLCKLKNNVKAKQLAHYLLEKHEIFIKDLDNKKGLPAEYSFVRLAIRDEQDNNKLLQALYQFKEFNTQDYS